MFKKILIANRGEIACRIIAACKKLGIKTVAVYSDADARSRHVNLADESVYIGAAPSAKSYLRMDAMIEACQNSGAQAIHPGFGFLSESAEFAKKVEEAGLVFIGPKHAAIAALGDKIASKKLAASVGVNVVPGVAAAIEDPQDVVKIAREVGYPVMIKATAGGGGKGMREAYNDAEAMAFYTLCRNEARDSFSNDEVFIEKFIEHPRHIEIQILGDAHGNVIYLNERECSIQRRHQKVTEEAPSASVSAEMRQAMGEQAVMLAKAVNYQSSGTVEFVVGRDGQFHFLEMNTRLQVEHTVTELITGLDIVELMLRIAAGEKLPLTQSEVTQTGWAMECRINAEDSARHFLPAIGRITRFIPPKQTIFASGCVACALPDVPYAVAIYPAASDVGGVRVDTGVQEGGEISMYYDSMIAKLIVHGRDRQDAIKKMQLALDSFVVQGVASNVLFHANLYHQPAFIENKISTAFMAEHYENGYDPFDTEGKDMDFHQALAVFMQHRLQEHELLLTGQLDGYGSTSNHDFVVIHLGKHGAKNTFTKAQVEIESPESATRKIISINNNSYEIESNSRLADVVISGTVNGECFAAQVERGSHESHGNTLVLRVKRAGLCMDALVVKPHVAELYKKMPQKSPPDLSRFVLAPMPGRIVEIGVMEGQKVQAGERVAVIEAMKMENIIVASKSGTIKTIAVKLGDSVAVDQSLMELA